MKNIDINQVRVALKAAVIQELGTFEQRSRFIGERRNYCSDRDFHRISAKRPGTNICEDCELWFDDDSGASYRVDPHLL